MEIVSKQIMINFIVYIHCPHHNQGGGTVAEFELAKRISQKGYPVKVYYPWGPIHSGIFDEYATLEHVNDDTVAIYCHVTHDNPLKAKKVVRWIIYSVPDIEYKRFADDEIIYYHIPFCKNNITNQRLFVMSLSDKIVNRNESRDVKVCYAMKKGMEYYKNFQRVTTNVFPHSFLTVKNRKTIWEKKINENKPSVVEIPPYTWSQEQCIDLFNKSEYFFCYDPCSFLVIMASLCGCIVVQDPIDGYTEEEWMYACGITTRLKGVAYGVENIEYARSTIQDASGPIKELMQSSEKSVTQFLSDIESKSYNMDKCYKYHESANCIGRGGGRGGQA